MVKTLRVRLLAALALALLLDPALVAAVQSVEFCHKGKEKIKGVSIACISSVADP